MIEPLSVGKAAPKFALQNQNDETVRLADFKGGRLLVYFYPKAMTPGCTQQACGLRDTLDELTRRGVKVVGISPDPVKRLKKFEEKETLNFPLLSDEDHAIAEAFGVWGPKSFMGRTFDGIHRISFLIGPTGKVEHVFTDFVAKHHQDVVVNYLDGKTETVKSAAAQAKPKTDSKASAKRPATSQARKPKQQ